MSAQWGPNAWQAHGFASLKEYEQWLDDQAQAAALARWQERRQRGERGCLRFLIAALPALLLWAATIALRMQPWRVLA